MKKRNFFSKYKKDKQYQKYYREAEQIYDLAIQIAESRKAKRLTQSQLAKKVGMPQSQIARIESGTNNITIETLNKIANVLDKKLQLA